MLVILRPFLLHFIDLFSCKPLRFNRQQAIKLSHFIDLFLLVIGPKTMLSVSAAVAKIVIALGSVMQNSCSLELRFSIIPVC